MIAVLKLIYKYIVKNKGRSLFIGITIMISAGLITSLALTIDDFKKEKLLELKDNCGGYYDGYVETKNQEYLKNLDNMSIIEDKSYTISLNNLMVINKKNPTNTMMCIGIDNNALSIFNFKFKEGRQPTKSNEIALESWIVKEMEIIPKVGDEITLSYEISGKDKGTKNKVTDKFTLVGTFEYIEKYESNKNLGIAYVTLDYAKDTLMNKAGIDENEILYAYYIRLIPRADGRLLERDDVYVNLINSKLMEWYLQGKTGFDIIGTILFTIMSISSTIILYNMFNASTMIRTSEIGMLKAIGMSPKQIKAMIIGEGIVLGVIFIFIGVILGSFSYEVTKAFMKMESIDYSIKSIPTKAFVLSYIFGIVSILIGSISSAIKMSQMYPMEAINCRSYLDVKNVRFNETNELGGTTNKFLWDMAKCNIKRNKIRFIITTVSIITSIGLFLLVSYIMNSQNPSYGFKNSFGADFIIENLQERPQDQITKEEINKIKNVHSVKEITSKGVMLNFINVTNYKDKVTKEGLDYINEESKKANKNDHIENGYYYLTTITNEYDTNSIEKLKPNIKEGTIDIGTLENEPVCILIQNMQYNNLTKFKVGDKIFIAPYRGMIKDGKLDTTHERELTIVAILENDEYKRNDGTVYTEIIMSEKAGEKYLNNKKYMKKQVKINISNSSDYENVKEKLRKIVDGNQSFELIEYKEELAKVIEKNFKINVFLYSFVVMTAVSSIANIFSIMTMNIVLRKKEFAMLRAVGMSKSEMKKLIMNESFIYGGFGGLIGLPAGVVISYLFFLLMRKHFIEGMIWIFPLTTIAIITLLIFVICYFASFYSWRKLFKEDIITSIRVVE